MDNYTIPNQPLKQSESKYKIPPIVANKFFVTEAVEYFIKPLGLESGRDLFDPQNKNTEGKTEKEFSGGRISKLGTPIACPFTLILANQQSIVNNNQVTTPIGVHLDDTLITLTQNKKLITTSIQGNILGNVVEYIGLDDYKINIQGRYNFSNGRYNQDEIKTLFKELNRDKPYGVECWYLTQFGITDIIITDYDFPQVEGQFSTQYFTINAISFFKQRITNYIIK